MALVAGRINRLGLGAEHDFVDQMLVILAPHLGQNAVEMSGPHHLAERNAHLHGAQEFGERAEFFGGRRLVHAVDERRLLRLQFLGRRDIGLDHEFFDELVGIEAEWRHHPLDQAMGVEYELAFGEIEFERLAGVAAFHQHVIGAPQGPEHGRDRAFRF